MATMSRKCPLRNDWRDWPRDKQLDRLFMICPSCGQNGSKPLYGPQVGPNARRIADTPY